MENCYLCSVTVHAIFIQHHSSNLIGRSLVTCHSLKVLMHGDVIFRSIHLTLMHVQRVKQYSRRIFRSCPSIPNTEYETTINYLGSLYIYNLNIIHFKLN